MAEANRLQLPERNEIQKRALEAGLPEGLAQQLGRAGGERRLPEEILNTALFLTDEYVLDRETEATSTDEVLLEHYPAMVEAFVPDARKRERVLAIWNEDGGHKELLEKLVEHDRKQTA